ncbi:Chaperone protein DnaJ [subsurface metagenome]
MLNYYEILGIEPGCTSSEIKRSFRKKAKEMHPDLKASDSRNSEDQMKDLIDAYEILSNPTKRSDYDRTIAIYFSKLKFNYREYLKSRKDDYLSQSKLIFHDLLNSEYEEAIELYEYLNNSNKYFKLERYLDHEDYMDCFFLLAEAFEKKGEYVRACEMYKKLYIFELKKPYFHHFIEEVIERLRNITCFKMVSCLPAETVIQFIQDLIDFEFSRKDNAFFYKKIAEIYCNLGKKDLAIHYLHKGLKLDQKLPGVKKLKEKIDFTEIPVL